MYIHPRMALGAKLVLTALPLWTASYLVYLTIMGIFGGSDNAGVWFVGGIVLLLEALALGLLAFGIVTGLWQGPAEILRQLKHDWFAASTQMRSFDVHAMSMGDGDAEPFVDEDSPRLGANV